MNAIPSSPDRLFFSEAEIDRLRNPAEPGVRAMMLARLVDAAEACLDPCSEAFLDYRERRRPIWSERHGIFVVMPSLMALAGAYLFTRRERFGRAAVEAVLTIIDERLTDHGSAAWGMKTAGWRRGPYHDKGKLSQAMAWVYRFCRECFTDAERDRFVEFARESIRIARESWSQDWNFIASNTGVRGVLAGFWYRAALAGEMPLAELDPDLPDFSEEVRAIECHFNLGFDSDGAPFEGPDYASCIPFITGAAHVLRRLGYPDLLTNRNYRRFLEYLLYELAPGEARVNNLNDAERWGKYTVAGHLPLLNTRGGEILPWLAHRLDLAPGQNSQWLHGPGPCVVDLRTENLIYFLLWWDEQAPVRTPEELGYPLSRHFKGRGVVSMRTGWEPSSSLVTHLASGNRYRCHRQSDANHLTWHHAGETILDDAGYGAVTKGDRTKPMDPWFRRTCAHNTVMIDGQGQRGNVEKPGWPVSEILHYGEEPGHATSLGDCAGAYGRDHAVLRALRRVVVVRRPFPALLVIDSVQVDENPCETRFLWHSHPGNRLSAKEDGWTMEGARIACDFFLLGPSRFQVTMSEFHGMPRAEVVSSEVAVEMLLVGIPRSREEPRPMPPRLLRGDAGRFTVEIRNGDATATVTASARWDERKRLADPVRMEWSRPAETQ